MRSRSFPNLARVVELSSMSPFMQRRYSCCATDVFVRSRCPRRFRARSTRTFHSFAVLFSRLASSSSFGVILLLFGTRCNASSVLLTALNRSFESKRSSVSASFRGSPVASSSRNVFRAPPAALMHYSMQSRYRLSFVESTSANNSRTTTPVAYRR